jgi:hypothetical protein
VAEGVRVLSELERSGGVVALASLAERISAEHRAYDTAVATALGQIAVALDRAMDAGDLLIQAKAQVKWGAWEEWVQKNVQGLSVRRAQEYMYLAHGREPLEELKARGSAFSSIQNALEFLRMVRGEVRRAQPREGVVGPVPGTSPLTPAQEKVLELRERKKRRMLERAEYAIRSGNVAPPADLKISAGAWEQVLYEALKLRKENLPNVIDALGHELHTLIRHARPEEVGRRLAEPTNDYDEAEYREGLIENLREGVAWLTRVIEEADAARRWEG